MHIAIFFLFVIRITQQLGGSLTTAQNTHLQATYSKTGMANTYISVQVTFTGLIIPSTLMYGKIGSDPGVLSASDLQHVNPYNRMDMDPQGMYIGRTQYLNFPVTAGQPAILYLRVTDFTTTTRKNATISYSYTISQGMTPSCAPCRLGTNYISPTSCICGPCGARFKGIDCSIPYTTLSNGVQSQATVSSIGVGQRYLFFDIPSTNSITMTYQISAGYSQLGLQFKTYQDQLAGFPNVIIQGFQMAVFPLQGTQPANTLSITAGGSSISVCVIYYGGSNGLLNISYQEATTSNVLVIVLGVLGGVLFVALVIAACYIAKKARSPGQVQANQLPSLPSDQNRLSQEQLNKYFPPVLCSAVFNNQIDSSAEQTSIAAMKVNPTTKQEDDKDCVICLCPVAPSDLMRGTYCRHLFHTVCLENWFKKQRNCPYCRQEFDRKGVVAHYTRLVRLQGGKILAGVQLVKAIFKGGSKLQIQDVKDCQ